MQSPLQRLYRRARFGKPIVVVSGLPRSGTSMMMQMLEAGGLEILTDRIRSADESNPQGYYELERVKDLDKGGDPSWLEDARGKTVKIIAFLLRYLPENLNYRIIFMQRDLEEIVASQANMLLQREAASETDDDLLPGRVILPQAALDELSIGRAYSPFSQGPRSMICGGRGKPLVRQGR